MKKTTSVFHLCCVSLRGCISFPGRLSFSGCFSFLACLSFLGCFAFLSCFTAVLCGFFVLMPASAQIKDLPGDYATGDPAKFFQNMNLPFAGQEEKETLLPIAQLKEKIEIKIEPAKAPYRGSVAFKLSIKNNTDRPLSFDAENASLSFHGSEKIRALSMAEISKHISCPDNPSGYGLRSLENTLSAAVTVGAVQTVEGEVRLLGPIDKRYGYDNICRRDKLARFSKRVLWPGDSTSGFVYFKAGKSAGAASVELSAESFYKRGDKVSLAAVAAATK